MPPVSLSLFQEHCRRWSNGCGSTHCDGARRVFARGKIPADVLLIGEAPGESENVLGVPFVGPAGQLLDRIVARAVEQSGRGDLRLAFTNVVCCIPREDDGGKAGEPDDDQLKACAPRLLEFYAIARPRLLVTVGTVARDWLDPKYKHAPKLEPRVPTAFIDHPARIGRSNVAMQSVMFQRAVVTLANAFADLPETAG